MTEKDPLRIYFRTRNKILRECPLTDLTLSSFTKRDGRAKIGRNKPIKVKKR